MCAGDGRQAPRAARRLTVHVGVQKTGSTAFHHFIKLNSARILRHLVVANELINIQTRALGRAAIAFSLNPDAGTEAALRRTFAGILAALPAGDQPVLLTHENLAGAMPGNGGETQLFPMLPRIARLLVKEAQGFDLSFVCYTRRQEQWLESVWAQAIRTDGYTGTYAQFLQETAGIAGWNDLTARLADAIGADRLLCLAVEEEEHRLKPGCRLLRHAGLPDEEIAALEPLDQPVMARLNAGALEFMRQVNAAPLNPHARAKIARLVTRCQPLFNADFRPQGNLS
ncbi:hypothetical protein F8A10_02210 [Paracoccus kondratievae]|uniref:Uncharacterized protein n=1 Tax=Paracoccus kondratievae TaxID=135740 RepID=A0AAD3NQN9_9RHOB|nr:MULTISPECIES: hypothetical protein [Paracoccus]QFQ86344.1 hypothetical protein F8A10_02210 [Paracoccus kondratievae]GLK62606.1 hypothetical protein GCM10017635_00740 [Paracoccus kondratievae]SMG12503.1 hypothetical protein SAMN02746000_00580 [Paracoccus sp. J56]